jgi:hypothetical protein
MGVKGILPLGCLPPWGREGVTLIVSVKIISPYVKKSDKLLHPDRIKNYVFFPLPPLQTARNFKKPVFAGKRMLLSFRPEMMIGPGE